MLIAVIEKDEITSANNLFFKRLLLLRHEKFDIIYATAGGSDVIQIFYSNKYDFWWGNFDDKRNGRFWNPFGLKRPKPGSATTGKCQINYSTSVINSNTGGLFAKNNLGNLYLLHNGRVGGGQKGVGKIAFANYYTGETTSVSVNGQEMDYFVVTELNSSRFYQNVLDFVTTIYDFKTYVKNTQTKEKRRGTKRPLPGDEYLGIKTYNLPARTVVASNEHAIITKKLISELQKLNFTVKRDQYRDAYTVDDNDKINRIFEVKSSLSMQALYTAIGQLKLHGLFFNSKKFFVTHRDVDPELIKDLKKLDIHCLLYNWTNGDVNFYDLKRVTT